MIERRGGWAYFKKYREVKQKIRDTGFNSLGDYIKAMVPQFMVSLMSTKLRLWVFVHLLRME